MKLEPKKYEAPKYEYPIHDINWTVGAGRPAGVYWLDGRTVLAAHDSVAESVLVERGAILIATLRFERDPLETVHRSGVVERIASAAAVRAFLQSAAS